MVIRSRSLLLAVLFLIASVVVLSSAAKAQVTLTPSQTTYITEYPDLGGPDSTHDSDAMMYAIGDDDDGFLSYPLIQFDLTPYAGQIVAGSTVTISLYVIDGNPDSDGLPRSVSIYNVLTPWDTTTVTYDNFSADGTAGLWLLNSNNTFKNGFNFGPYIQTPNNPVYGLDFGPYTAVGQDPNDGSVVPSAQITSLLLGMKGYTQWIRTFGTQNGLENVPAIAKQMGFKTAIGAYIGNDTTVNNAQIANLIAAANAGDVDIAIVGNETLSDNLQSESQLITYIQQVKSQVPPGVLVTYVDEWRTMVAHPNVIAAVDVVAVNIYPFWDNVPLDQALSALQSDYATTMQNANGKTVIITETGWPSAGNPPSSGSPAVPSSANAAAYFSSVETWARNANIQFFYMEAYDEPWKPNHMPYDYPSWGIWDSSGNLKSGMASVFQ